MWFKGVIFTNFLLTFQSASSAFHPVQHATTTADFTTSTQRNQSSIRLTVKPGPAKSHWTSAAFLKLIPRSASSQTSFLVLFMDVLMCQWLLCSLTFKLCPSRWQHKQLDGNTGLSIVLVGTYYVSIHILHIKCLKQQRQQRFPNSVFTKCYF